MLQGWLGLRDVFAVWLLVGDKVGIDERLRHLERFVGPHGKVSYLELVLIDWIPRLQLVSCG